MTHIYFVRHGLTKTNVKKVWTSSTDVPLSRIGIQQSKQLVATFKNTKIDFIYVSPMSRTKTTAKRLATNRKLKIKIDNRLKERNFGKLELKPTLQKDMLNMFDWYLNSDLGMNVEKIQDMYFKRIKPFIEEIIKKHKNKTVVVIAHSWVGRLFRFYFLNENPFALTLTPINCEPIEFKI